ncbi:histone acetyltransferase type B catalytic subunit [Tremella mesenterica]|uniref:Histone acetyltransferase type B catalytic subunit n=1 Tax=Tremella mesenterica TaxID=5217 RepID=A0A4Q1BHX4_TREME|nr:histone acetyltransferase type B catalytic subunit [Tremella mesenterica]
MLTPVRAHEDDEVLKGDERQNVQPFHPEFTYPIFGEEEMIFGYKNLDVSLEFSSGSLRQHLTISHSAQLSSSATPPDDIEGILYKFIPPDYSKSSEDFDRLVQEDSLKFKPLGEKIGEYSRPAWKAKGKGKGKKTNGAGTTGSSEEGKEGEVKFEMYKTTWNTPGFREYHRRMQIFILFFIEGGSYVHEDEDAWEFITLYERRTRSTGEDTYHFVGYTSVYPFWCYPDSVRLRLSQFVILPPYQQLGHGSALYSTLYQHVLSRPEVAELTVEDPAEAFEDLRDRNDLRWLVEQGVPDDPLFGQIGGTRAERVKWEMGLRKKYKIAQRQFDRLLEMLLLRRLDRSDPVKVKAYRLHVKARLYRFNYEMLCQMSLEERKEALSKTYESVIEDYDRILSITF